MLLLLLVSQEGSPSVELHSDVRNVELQCLNRKQWLLPAPSNLDRRNAPREKVLTETSVSALALSVSCQVT